MGLKVVATPSWQANLDEYRAALQKFVAKPNSGYSYYNFDSPQGLLDSLTALLQGSDDCLEILEIEAHGNPSSCDGIFVAISPTTATPNMSADDFASGLAKLRLCQDFKLYLTGCNTGLTENGAGPALKPMAEVLAKKLKRKVYGTKGKVTTGSHAAGTVKVEKCDPYPGTDSGKGDGAYKEFKP